ncbi:MAG TPA: lysine--tRNA ligase [Candidatus Eisenbacteria bacterium]|nr:lysine--tRNA ligase [Candidatus Eisenbacteria bacterium]
MTSQHMFWADQIATDIKKRGKKLEWVDDMKTPSGRVHVGALRGVMIHDLIYKCLKDQGVNSKYTYVFDDHDPMDGLPVYLDQEKYLPGMGKPLFQVPSPEKGYDSYAEYFAKEFQHVFNTIGCDPEIIWASQLYLDGKMNDVIRECLDKSDEIKKVYETIYKKTIPGKMYYFQPVCPTCGKISTTTVTDWDGDQITFSCDVNKVDFTKGCGYSGKASPFSTKEHFAGKLPWKVEWPCVWKVLGITVEGAGKDHMTAGGSHDVAQQLCEKVLHCETPYPLAYEWFILGKQKMSSSKGIGASAIDMLKILPPELLRFLMVRTKINSEINFDLANPQMIPALFDEYQKCADAYFNKGDEDLARVFELSYIGKPVLPPTVRFSLLAQWIQMPNMEGEIRKEGAEIWVPYAKYYVENFAPDSEKFSVKDVLPQEAATLTAKQKELLAMLMQEVDKKLDAEKFQFDIYELGKSLGLGGKETFSAIYKVLIGKDHGPKAAWLILSLDRDFVKKRFQEAIVGQEVSDKKQESNLSLTQLNRPDIFSLSTPMKEKYPSTSIGVAIIKGVKIEKQNKELEKEKQELQASLAGLTTEQIGEFPEIKSYRKLYKEMGVDWHSRRPSPEALLRRVAQGKGLYSINTCVDAYNLIVMKHHVSIGAFDLDAISMPTRLDIAKGGEKILLLGDSEESEYKAGEIAYFDEKGPFNLDFNYRDAQRTLVSTETKNIYVNVDGIYDVSPEKVQEVLEEVCNIITKYCGGTVETFGVVTKNAAPTSQQDEQSSTLVAKADVSKVTLTHDEAFALLQKYMQSPNLIKHSLAAEAAMKGIYEYLYKGSTDAKAEEVWGITGLLHDIDYEVAQKEEKLDQHGRLLFDRDPKLVEEPIQHAIKAHNYTKTGTDPETDMDWAIATVDQLTGLVVSSTLISPTKKMADIDADFVLRKFNKPAFSQGVDRENIRLCETKLGIPLLTFIEITLSSMQKIADKMGL